MLIMCMKPRSLLIKSSTLRQIEPWWECIQHFESLQLPPVLISLWDSRPTGAVELLVPHSGWLYIYIHQYALRDVLFFSQMELWIFVCDI